MFIRFDVINERDGQTDGRTLRDSKDRAYACASRGKNATASVWLVRQMLTKSGKRVNDIDNVTLLTY